MKNIKGGLVEWLLIILACVIVAKALADTMQVHAKTYDESSFDEPTVIRCTCYHDSGITASGQHTRQGIVAGKQEWLGCVAALYEVDEDGNIGDFIGYYEFTDTGAGIDTDGDGYGDSIKTGQSIDVWQPTYWDCQQWIDQYGDYVYMQLIKGVG